MPKDRPAERDRQVPRPIGDRELLALLDRPRDLIDGHGPYIIAGCDAWADGRLIVRRYMTLGEALAQIPRLKPHLNTFDFRVATGDYSERKHEGCEWWCLPPVKERRHRAWRSRYDPRKRAADFAKWLDDEPDIDRARAAILARCRKCPDCRREAGEVHLKKLERQQAKDRMSIAELMRMPLE